MPSQATHLLAVSLLFSASGTAWGQLSIVGRAPGLVESRVLGLSADGRVAAGSSFADGFVPAVGFTWSASGGRHDFGLEPGMPLITSVYGISGDGQTVVGTSGPNAANRHAFRYSGTGTYQDIGRIGNYAFTTANAVNQDGSVIVGLSRGASGPPGVAWRWTAGSGMQSLGYATASEFYSEARGISRDGSTIVGFGYDFSRTDAWVWKGDQGMTLLPGLAGSDSNIATNTNGLGTIVVGSSWESNRPRAVMWQGESTLNLGATADMGSTDALAVSDDGHVVVGQAQMRSGDTLACVWTPSTGMRLLSDYLSTNDISFPAAWHFASAASVSADGHTIGGFGYFTGDGNPTGFVVTIPAPSWIGLSLISIGCVSRRRR